MGMGGGMSPQDMMRHSILQAKGEMETLAGRLAVTRESIQILESALVDVSEAVSGAGGISLLLAMVKAQLVQLRNNEAEGEARVKYLQSSIEKAESTVKRAVIIPSTHPADQHRRR